MIPHPVLHVRGEIDVQKLDDIIAIGIIPNVGRYGLLGDEVDRPGRRHIAKLLA